MNVDLSKLTPIEDMRGDEEEDTTLLREMAEHARGYLLRHSWCDGTEQAFFGLGVGGIVAVFLFRIRPAKEGVDEYVWVVVGDLPPLYITTDEAPNAACALDGYAGAMQAWVDAVMRHESTKGLAPVNVEPTMEAALGLKSRLEFIHKEILSAYATDLR